ncbi:embigin isoform X2 [Motacilla alba alba]|uniref:embigin isoform X2 n=1 Tax=Motacilla alba alba TaxID=1094192 RepID=UPI0018D530D7|nr:embigin isoform X2 [Motacilla alba alba]
MPATFSGRCLLLLLLLCTSLSGVNPADSAMTTPDSNQTWVNSVTKMQAGREPSDAATQELKPGSKHSADVSEYEIVLPGVSEKNISLTSPGKVELTCKLDENSNLKNPVVTWKKGSETISHTSKTQNSWTIQVTISGSSELGSYTCFLKAEKEVSATFHLHVPPIEGREKPIITYIGDTAVMVCKTEYHPKAWMWYMTNGTELASIDKILPTDKYQIKNPSASVNRLEIFKLTTADSGVYWCEATFELGDSKARFEIKVLSIAEPLKPFIAVVAEVAILVTAIALYEVYSKRKAKGGEKEFDQIEQLKSEDNVTGKHK